MKKMIALLLCGALSVSALAACGNESEKVEESQKESGSTQKKEESVAESQEESQEENLYEETVTFTLSSLFSLSAADSGIDYTADPLYKWVCEKFNVEIEMWNNTNEEKTSIWINSGDMPDALWTGGIPKTEAEQGLLRPMPEDWETRWPNLAQMVATSGAADLCKVDGVLYGLPHAIVGSFTDITSSFTPNAMFFRKDFAEQVGMADFGADVLVTISELEEYLTAVKDAGLVEIPLEGADWAFRRIMNYAYSLPSDSSIASKEDAYYFVPQMDAYTEMMTKAHSLYEAGLLDPDYYQESDADSKEDFCSGQAAALAWAGTGGDIWGMFNMYNELTGNNAAEDLGVIVVTKDDGTFSVSNNFNFWGTTVFNPDTDDATFERILDILDWLSTDEANYAMFLGVPGEEFEIDADGNVTIISQSDRIAGKDAFYGMTWICGDEWWYTGLSGYDPKIIEYAAAYNKVMMAAPYAYQIDMDQENHQSDAKSNYSVSMSTVFKEIVCGDADVQTAIEEFIEENKNMWEPYIAELNEAYR